VVLRVTRVKFKKFKKFKEFKVQNSRCRDWRLRRTNKAISTSLTVSTVLTT
jgi:hypothetical protein